MSELEPLEISDTALRSLAALQQDLDIIRRMIIEMMALPWHMLAPSPRARLRVAVDNTKGKFQ